MDHIKSKITIDFAQYSDGGRKGENQDTIGARLPDDAAFTHKGIAIAIADGVSSSAAAREASQTAITGFLTDYYATPDTWSTRQSGQRVLQSLNRSLWGLSRNSVRGEGLLTTFSALILKGNNAYLFHVGDTRIYLWRSGQLEQLTRDHCQSLSREETYLSRALGADVGVEVDFHTLEVHVGDVFILTSDGIHDHLPEDRLRVLIKTHCDHPQQLVEKASKAALDNGSDDNLSIQVAAVRQLGHANQDDAMDVLARLPFPPLLDTGQTLDGLRVEKPLHESNRSQVYQVQDDAGRRMIMKTPSVLYSDDPAYLERFVMEAWIGARIQSPQVARVMSGPEPRSCLYYLTEYIPGPTLGQLMAERGPLAINDAVDITGQLIKGIRSFHRKETLHQDIKPDNIVMGPKGPVIVDFGSCWVASVEELEAPFTRDKILGTMDYSAPEYRYGGQTGPRSDQFSLAVLLYEMLTGQKPYGDAYGKALNERQLQKLRYQPARHHNPMVPLWLDKALEKALSLQPQQRYDALSEWWQDLQRPNPRWTRDAGLPILQRRPEWVWPVLAISGWAIVLVLAWHLWKP